jgi:diacylglycerol kinase (ATP)
MPLVEPKIKYILNPTAGQGSGRQVFPALEKNIQMMPGSSEIVSTQYAGHAVELAYKAVLDGYDGVIAVGGDGTSNEVLNGLMQAYLEGHRNTRMGIIGVGRGNDFAYAFGIPPGLHEGLEVISKGNSIPIDVGRITGGDYPQGRYFGNGVGIGFDAVVGFEAMKLSHLHGFLNYAVAAIRTIFLFFNAPSVEVEYDGKKFTQPALMISIMNGTRMGGGFKMAPESLTNDGMLDICVAGQMSRLGILMMIPRFMKGTQVSRPEIKMLRAEKIQIVAQQGSLPAHADGETICKEGKELTVEVIKQPLAIFSGRGS